MTTRRQFLQSAIAAGAALSITSPGHAIEPIKRSGKSHIRLGLVAYSYRDDLTPRRGEKKPRWTMYDFVEKAAELNVDAVELTSYYFPDPSPRYLADLKGHCSRLGLDVSGSSVGNNFCWSNQARLREEIRHVKRWIEHASRLGAKTLRIFAGGPDRGDTAERARDRCIAAIEETCEYAGRFGIYLALENHGGITNDIDQTLSLVQAIKSPWFGVNWDCGNFISSDPYADLTRLAPYALTCHMKTEIHRKVETPRPQVVTEAADLPRVIGILRSAGYRGYVGLEYEGREDAHTGVPRAINALRKLMG
jgi:sugar phosphate isomerase/epimerase